MLRVTMLLWRVSLRWVSLLGRVSLLWRVAVATRRVSMTTMTTMSTCNSVHQGGHEPLVFLVMVLLLWRVSLRWVSLLGRVSLRRVSLLGRVSLLRRVALATGRVSLATGWVPMTTGTVIASTHCPRGTELYNCDQTNVSKPCTIEKSCCLQAHELPLEWHRKIIFKLSSEPVAPHLCVYAS